MQVKKCSETLYRVAVCIGDLYCLGHGNTPSVTAQFHYLCREFRQITENQALLLNLFLKTCLLLL